ncbi:DUF2642 domain-containing protein [Paenibacillus protaetiae]|uniref:DUF2642 domain-containing protein n=1 Tax=Paenibacillus protaetiae TaxID=2509456 RepID=A0A4V0YF65_9BACL|nr:DUF2642 domain-containing protein [Paenibacillus protaetiae]QAY66631.1 DUF2642 domain-containing protein [Paenibacillus protaetiae]
MEKKHPLQDKWVELLISDHAAPVQGKLIDIGQDIFVIQDGVKYVYVPIIHLQQLRFLQEEPRELFPIPEELKGRPLEQLQDPVSYRKILLSAKGMFSEIYVTGSQSIHGYLTSVMNDFFVFYSPVYHTVIISLQHLKYLVPYHPNITPYQLSPEQFPLRPSTITLARTFEGQLRKLVGEFVILDLGVNPNKIGLLKNVQDNMAELVNANGASIFVHIDHIQTLHIP